MASEVETSVNILFYSFSCGLDYFYILLCEEGKVMSLSLQVINQVAVMFILMAAGFILRKLNLLNEAGTKSINKLIINLVMPCLLINAFQRDFEPEMLYKLGMAGVLAIIVHIVAIIITTAVFSLDKSERKPINIFSSVYSNCGFMGFPLLSALFGDTGVFLGSAYVAVFNVFYWTHGYYVYSSGKGKISIRKIILNPGILAVIIALTLYFLRIRLPGVIGQSVKYIADMNTPLAMMVIGTYFAGFDFKKVLSSAGIYGVSVLKLAIIPIASIITGSLMGIDSTVNTVIAVSSACPVAAISAIFAAEFELDTPYASGVVAATTVLSIISLPLIVLIF